VRKIVAQVDWPCQVHKNYANENLGLKRRVSTGLDWVFSTVERAIILEDDCVTHPDFFTYCEALLNRYEQDERVWVISGDNHQKGKKWAMRRIIFQNMLTAGVGPLGEGLGNTIRAIFRSGLNGKKAKPGDSSTQRMMKELTGKISFREFTAIRFIPRGFILGWLASGITAGSLLPLMST
jgi:hypothetical protein